MRIAIFFALVALAAARPTKRYDGYKVIKIIPETAEQLAVLRTWMDEFDFWLEPVAVGHEAHLFVGPQHASYVRAKLLANGLTHDLHIADVQKDIDASFDEIERLRAQRPDTMAFDYNNWNTFTDYLAEYDALVARCPAGFTCRTHDIGVSTEGRPLRTLHLTHNTPQAGRHTIWYDSMMHCREWLAGATLMKVIERIFTSTDPAHVRFRDSYDWIFLPQMNPDGYEWTWSTDRMWRKNRRVNEGAPALPTCVGVDLNRNYAANWGGPGASGDPCSDTYRGPSAQSEVETQAVDNYAAIVSKQAHKVVTWINFHTYGHYWLTPWGNCTVPADHDSHQMVVANAAADAIQATYGTTIWRRGNSCTTLYETSGGIIDRMKAAHNITWAHTPELRGNRFDPPASEIEPSFTEVWNGLVAKLDAMVRAGIP